MRSLAADYLVSLVLAATKPPEEQNVYRETLQEAGKYPSTLRRIFFEILKSAVEEAVWRAFVTYASRIRETDPSLEDVADDVVAT